MWQRKCPIRYTKYPGPGCSGCDFYKNAPFCEAPISDDVYYAIMPDLLQSLADKRKQERNSISGTNTGESNPEGTDAAQRTRDSGH